MADRGVPGRWVPTWLPELVGRISPRAPPREPSWTELNWPGELIQVDVGLIMYKWNRGQAGGGLVRVVELKINNYKNKQIDSRGSVRVWWEGIAQGAGHTRTEALRNVCTVSQQTTKPHMGVVKPAHKVVPMETWLIHTHPHVGAG